MRLTKGALSVAVRLRRAAEGILWRVDGLRAHGREGEEVEVLLRRATARVAAEGELDALLAGRRLAAGVARGASRALQVGTGDGSCGRGCVYVSVSVGKAQEGRVLRLQRRTKRARLLEGHALVAAAVGAAALAGGARGGGTELDAGPWAGRGRAHIGDLAADILAGRRSARCALLHAGVRGANRELSGRQESMARKRGVAEMRMMSGRETDTHTHTLTHRMRQ